VLVSQQMLSFLRDDPSTRITQNKPTLRAITQIYHCFMLTDALV